MARAERQDEAAEEAVLGVPWAMAKHLYIKRVGGKSIPGPARSTAKHASKVHWPIWFENRVGGWLRLHGELLYTLLAI